MALHPEVAKFIASLPPPPPGPLDPVAMRAWDEAHVLPLAQRLPVHQVIDRTLPTSAGAVPVRVYTPTAAERHGLLVYLHGGAGFLGSLNTHDHVARELGNASGCVVVSVGYRLAPEHAFPAGLDDGHGVVQWLAAHGADPAQGVGWDGRTLALAGDSSGGGMVAALAARDLDEGRRAVTHQVLYYPGLDLDFDEARYASLRSNAVGYGLETAMLKPFNAFYIGSGAEPADPRVSPIKRADLRGLPPALVVSAEHDPLRDEAEQYAERLAAAGVPVVLRRYDGAGHGFVQHFSWLPEFHGVYAETAAFLQGGRS